MSLHEKHTAAAASLIIDQRAAALAVVSGGHTRRDFYSLLLFIEKKKKLAKFPPSAVARGKKVSPQLKCLRRLSKRGCGDFAVSRFNPSTQNL